MIRSWGNQATVDVWNGSNTKAARQAVPKDIWPVVCRKLDALDAAHRLEDVRFPPGNQLEALKGGQVGRHSLRVNDQYRITFEWRDGDAWEVRCEDYH